MGIVFHVHIIMQALNSLFHKKFAMKYNEIYFPLILLKIIKFIKRFAICINISNFQKNVIYKYIQGYT